jgi:hypothetical protein
MALHFQYLEIDGVEFDTYWQNGGYKKISDIIFAECHIFIVSNLWFYYSQCLLTRVRLNRPAWNLRACTHFMKISLRLFKLDLEL